MQGLVQISAVVLLLAGLAVSTPVGDCPPSDPEDFHMPDDSNCTIFYKCAHGVPVKFDCPAPLHFNARISVCDWPQNAGCAAGGGPTPDPPTCECTCPSPSTTPTPATTQPSTATPSRTEPTTVATTRGVCDAIGSCPVYTQNSLVVHLPHRTKCDVYCRCDHGVPIEMPCAPGTWFNAALQVCDWPANSGCVEGEGPTSPPATVKPTAAPPSSTSTSTTTAADPVAPLCEAEGTCPVYTENSVVKHLPHLYKCEVYCRCDHGVPIEMPCPDGLLFNKELEVCDWPWAAGCKEPGK